MKPVLLTSKILNVCELLLLVSLNLILVEDMSSEKRYKRAERALKVAPAFLNANMSRTRRMAKALRCDYFCSCDTVSKVLTQECSKGKQPHNCLTFFRENPGIVKNFRVLWASLPKGQTLELLMNLLREGNGSRLVGVKVCQQAFMNCTGISSSVLQNARGFVQKGQSTVLARKEMGMWMQIQNTSKAPRYLDPWPAYQLKTAMNLNSDFET